MATGKKLAILLLLQAFHVVFLRRIFVSHVGQDTELCGDSASPCRSIRHTVNISNNGDEILIDSAQGAPYKECENFTKCYIELNKSLSLIGNNGTATIECKKHCDFFKIRGVHANVTKIEFGNLEISTSASIVQCSKASFELVIKGCTLRAYAFAVRTRDSTYCSIQAVNSSFLEGRTGGIWLRCLNLSAYFTSTFFNASPVNLQTVFDTHRRKQAVEVFISNCVFDGGHKSMCSHLLTIITFAVTVNITVQQSTFTDFVGLCTHEHSTRSLYVIYIRDFGYSGREKTVVTLNKLLVKNSYGHCSGIYLGPAFQPKKIFKVQLLNSDFRNNSGSLFVSENGAFSKVKGPGILLINNSFEKNIKGAGVKTCSAVRFRGCRSRVISCRFIDNTARNNPYAPVVYVFGNAAVTFQDCYFKSAQSESKSIQIHAQENTALWFRGRNTINITALKDSQLIFLRMPSKKNPGVLLKGFFGILCPLGYLLGKVSKCIVSKNQIICRYLNVRCEPCPRKTYSLKRGELHYNITRNGECHVCPRGGQCENGQVVAKPNFWGYKNKETVSFLSCPPKYCCESDHCTSYDSCYGNRTGTLCGQCLDGTSESLFNTGCKPNNECSSLTFWPGIFVLLILYLFFFLYHKEITSFVKNGVSLKHSYLMETRISSYDEPDGIIRSRSAQQRHRQESGLLKIVFHYYQVVHLLRNSVGASNGQHIFGKIEKTFGEVLNLILIHLPSFDCPFHRLRPVQKASILHSVGFCLLALVVVLGFVFKLQRMVRFRRNSQALQREMLIPGGQIQEKPTLPFSMRVFSAFTHISLLMYSSSAQLCLSLLHCVPLGEGQVLFMDGNVKCYQTFQYVVIAYVISSILPFCLVPVLGSYLLKSGRISVTHFCFGCLLPLPFCCFWMHVLLKDCSLVNRESYVTVEEQENNDPMQFCSSELLQHNDSTTVACRAAILRVLVGPFRPHKSFLCFPASFIPWEGFLIFRRLLLIIVLTFVYDNRFRMIIVLTICVAMLVCHMCVHPFINPRENCMETISLSTLIVLCGFTLIKALYQGEDFSSSSSSSHLLSILNLVENVLIIIPLSIIIFFVIISLLVRLVLGFLFGIRKCYQRLRRILCRR